MLGLVQGYAQIPKRNVECLTTTQSDIVVIDGHISDTFWMQGEWQKGFVQRQPKEGASPTVITTFKILSDLKYLYVAIQCEDPTPGSISQRMSRRDDLKGDWVEISLDANSDRRSAYVFALTAAG
ncbi:MAG: sugar-binding protein, partial [Bacteroidota bacterium]